MGPIVIPEVGPVPGGLITLSDRRTRRSWQVDVVPFELGIYPVTQDACRAGTTGPRYGDLDAIGWYRGNSDERPRKVGLQQPNSWGLHDTLGNVWEWCWDFLDPEEYGTYRVMRGGGWFDEHWSCRASVRRGTHPDQRVDDIGFRIARG